MKVEMNVKSVRSCLGFRISQGNNGKIDNWICYGYENKIYVSKRECLKQRRFLGSVCSMMIGEIV